MLTKAGVLKATQLYIPPQDRFSVTFNRTKLTNILCSIFLCCSLIPTPVYAELSIEQKVINEATRVGVPIEVVLYVVKHESSFNPKAVGDMNLVCKQGPHKGKPVYARGILQFTRCYWPQITDEQAFDVDFSLAKAMPMIADKETCKRTWTACRNYYRNQIHLADSK